MPSHLLSKWIYDVPAAYYRVIEPRAVIVLLL